MKKKSTLERALRPLACGVLLNLVVNGVHGGIPLGVPNGESLNDRRLGELKDLNGYFPFEVPTSGEAWDERSERVRERILVSQGLWPMPEKTPLNAVIHGRVSMGDYSVEKVYFESFPGFYVTGNLYRPIGRRGQLPGVLCPHGHWSDGRFTDNQRIRDEIVNGAERFENGGRSVLQARSVQLARMGCVVFHYDMIGYADCVQISFELAHRFAKQRPEMNQSSDWGLFSPQAESHLQNVMGLQTWNSIRSLDFLESLPEVDKKRLAVTGASGGGTQTFILGAIDPRPAVAFPAVMVSTAMQGGCTCENSTLLRIGTGNVEIAGLFAPKPLGLSGADDWTVEMSTKGFPELQALYRMLGNEKGVMLRALNHFGHNYNYVSRSAMYHWFNRHLNLGLSEPIVEQDYPRLGRDDLTVWNQEHPVPEKGPEFERKLLAHWLEDSQSQMLEAAESPATYSELAGPAIRTLIGRTFETAGTVEWALNEKHDQGGYLEMSGVLQNQSFGEAVPVLFLYPKEWKGTSVLWLEATGKAGLYNADGKPRDEIRRLLEAGVTVIGVDLHFQGESLAEGGRLESTRRVSNPREAAAYTFGYNHTVFVKRVHDVLTAVRFLRTHDEESKTVVLVGLEGAGHWAVAARSVLGGAVDRYAIDTGAFRFGDVRRIHDPDFLPGGAKYLDVPGFLLLGDTKPLWLAGEPTGVQQRMRRAYSGAGVKGALNIVNSAARSSKLASAVDWILQ